MNNTEKIINKKLEGNTATLGLSNWSSLTIKICDDCENLQYQFNNGDSKENEPIYEAEIEYVEDTENVTGFAEDEDGLFQTAFKTEEGAIFFISEFMRDDFGCDR